MQFEPAGYLAYDWSQEINRLFRMQRQCADAHLSIFAPMTSFELIDHAVN